jgi:MFS transporter, DHA1 family, quinolone resistance protein
MTESRLSLISIVHHMIHWSILGLLIPVLAIFQLDRGLTLVDVGLNAAIYSLATVLLELPTGGMADALGRRQVYLLSLVIHLVASALLLSGSSLLPIGTAFGLMGASRALSSGCMDAYFIDAFNDLEVKGPLQRYLGRVGASIPLSLALSGLAGGLLAARCQPGSDPGFGDRYSILFVVQLLIIGLQLILTLILIPSRHLLRQIGSIEKSPASVKTVIRDALRYGLGSRVVLWLLLGTVFWGVTFAALEQYWQPFVSGISPLESPTRIFGYLTAGYFLMGAVGSLTANLLFTLIGERYAAALGLLRVLSGALLILLASMQTVPGFALLYLTIFLLNGISDSPEQALFNENVPSGVRSTMLSFQSLFMQAGGGIAALVWGVLSQHHSIALAWRLAGFIYLCSGIFYLRILLSSKE